MPHDPARVADTSAWLGKATAEKAFKAFLTWRDRPFRKTHNLEELGEVCLTLDRSLKPVVDR